AVCHVERGAANPLAEDPVAVYACGADCVQGCIEEAQTVAGNDGYHDTLLPFSVKENMDLTRQQIRQTFIGTVGEEGRVARGGTSLTLNCLGPRSRCFLAFCRSHRFRWALRTAAFSRRNV